MIDLRCPVGVSANPKKGSSDPQLCYEKTHVKMKEL